MAERPHDLARPSERLQSTAEVLIAVVEKNRTQEVRVYLSAWKGCNLIDVRTYVEPCDMDGERRPTRRGVRGF
jgi:Transcriptional Coactivator p15 (PC4)